ncbi:MAG: TonB-dependent receptor [Thermoanaerobaculia bacterium]|jgi:outer membrane cobalamin receptor
MHELRVCVVVLMAIAALVPSPAARGEERDPSEATLEELLAMELTIASKTGTTAREAPGIVTLVTSEEIAASGARDLIDILRLVPGFDFGVDVQGVVGLGVRGSWGHEGKILMLLDGQEMNEPLYSTLQFGNRLPVSQISKIEIIRGPGSAIYGGNAELAVINIITKGAEELRGFAGAFSAGAMSDATARVRGDVSYGANVGAGSFTLHGSLADGNRSDGTFTDFLGDSYDMADNSELNDTYLNLLATWKNYKARLIVDDYGTTQRDEFGENLPGATSVDFNSTFFEATAVYLARPGLSITPRVNYKKQEPWKESNDSFYYQKDVERLTGNVTVNWDPSDTTSIVGGLEYYEDRATTDPQTDPGQYFPNGKREITYDNISAFAQGMLKTGLGNLTLGVRFEDHSEFGSQVVPRIGFTRVMGRFHVKLLASRAFRTPAIENIRLGSDIEPEETTAYEFETGYQIRPDLFVTANVFDTTIEKPIVYFFDSETDTEGYANEGDTGTRGIELEMRFRQGWGSLNAGYSYYEASNNEVVSYAVPGDDSALLAFPQSKFTVAANMKLGTRLRLSPSIVYYGSRYGYGHGDAEGNQVLEKFDSATLLNVFLYSPDLFLEGLTVGVGVYDALGEDFQFLQPYDNYHAPYPDTTREYGVRISYSR